MKAVAAELRQKYSARIGTASMRKFGCRDRQIYDAEKVRTVRQEVPSAIRSQFLLRDECDLLDVLAGSPSRLRDDNRIDAAFERAMKSEAEIQAKKESHPNKYHAGDFAELCLSELSETALENLLREMCLDPAVKLDGNWPWWFAEFVQCLREYHAEHCATKRAATVTTELGKQVGDELDYALETKCMVLIEGMARMGKTFSAKAWCDQRPGRARYVQVPSTNDEVGFFRAIAKALGVASGLGWKAVQLRERVEDVLQSGDLILVLDEAHYCWPVTDYRYALPGRINWIMTALVNKNAPVALITTPQFIKTQKVVEARTNWTSEQFTGRIGHYQKLPDSLSELDLSKVATALLPEGDNTSVEILVRYAQSSAKYLAGIEAVVKRARYLAKRAGRDNASRADIKAAIQESVIPSDSALATALETPQRGKRNGPVPSALMESQPVLKDRLSDRATSNLLDTSSSEPASRNRLESRRASDVLAPG